MNILIVNRYFYPDTPPYAAMLKDISQHLQKHGHSVEILTAQPQYKPDVKIQRQPRFEPINGVVVRRMRLMSEHGSSIFKAINSFWFPICAALQIIFSARRDIIWSATMPPIWQPLLLALAAKVSGARFIYHLQDIYPEIAHTSGILKNSFIYQILRCIDNFTLRSASQIVTLNKDMLETLLQRGDFKPKITLINNFAQTELTDKQIPKSVANFPKRFVFAGNLGRYQNLEKLVKTFASINPELAQLDLLGSGRMKKNLQILVEELNCKNVIFTAHLEVRESLAFISKCDFGIVSIDPHIYKYAYPSKTFHIMAAGLPILALVENESELAQTIINLDIGYSVDPRIDDQDLRQVILDLIEKPSQDHRVLRQKTKKLYAKQQVLENWIEMFKTLK